MTVIPNCICDYSFTVQQYEINLENDFWRKY